VAYWLVKSEPDECSIDDFAKSSKPIRWDGVRNYQARNFMREMRTGDQVLLYHSSCAEIGLAGIINVVQEAYDDPAQFDPTSPYFDANASIEKPRWSSVDMVYGSKFKEIVPLAKLKAMPELEGFLLVGKRGRLSVMPVSEQHWKVLMGVVSF
jgi:predicted RNA-binding protein with PUA-like domain